MEGQDRKDSRAENRIENTGFCWSCGLPASDIFCGPECRDKYHKKHNITQDQLVQYYDYKSGALTHSQKAKAVRFIGAGCLVQIDQNHWQCKPIAGYNTRTYDLARQYSWENYKCNCQGWSKKHICSHLMALMEIIGHQKAQMVLF